MDDGYSDASCIRESSRQFGERQKEQAVEIGRMARLLNERRRGYKLPDGFMINREAGRDPDQCADKDVARIVDTEIDPGQRANAAKTPNNKPHHFDISQRPVAIAKR